uniref:Ig-like domain-containing protein n=1 Tax=Maylandia zebra TaxID=106582 RepID=A0A3P9BF61_9CICH
MGTPKEEGPHLTHTTLLKNTALHFKPAHVGETLTFECQCEDKSAVMLYWYKQTLGNRPQLMSTYYKHSRNGTFQDPFNDPRFSLLTGNLLKISDLRTSDSATYYCVMSNLYDFKFCEGTIVSVKGSDQNIRALVYQLSSETLQPVHSMVLNCIVQPGTCDGEHSVYWFRKSEASLPGIIYTNGSRNDPCERKPNTQGSTCVYNLPMKSLNLSQHYCAVASCGHILYGTLSYLLLSAEKAESLLLVHFFSGALALTAILTGFLAFKLYKLSKQHRRCAGKCYTFKATLNSEYKENLHYAALRNHKTNRSRKKTDQTQSECVYSSVKEQR